MSLSFVTKHGTGPRNCSGTEAAYGFARNDYKRADSAGRARTKSKFGLASATRNWRCSWAGSKWGGPGAKTGIEKNSCRATKRRKKLVINTEFLLVITLLERQLKFAPRTRSGADPLAAYKVSVRSFVCRSARPAAGSCLPPCKN